MAVAYNTSVVLNGLTVYLDAANPKSYSGSGTVWNDLSNNNNTCTLTDAPTYSSSNNGLFTFNGTSNQATINNSSSVLFGTNLFSVEAWIYPTASSSTILSKGTAVVAGTILFFISAANSLSFGSAAGVAQYTISLNQWLHVVYSKEGTGTNQGKLYVNGSLVASGTDTNNYNDTNALKIGVNRGGTAFFSGNIPVVKLYNNFVLLADQVNQNFNALRGRYGI